MTTMHDDVVVITGAARGVGAALAREAGARGARVVITDVSDGQAVADEITGAGGHAVFVKTDITDYASVQELAQFVLTTYGTVNVLVNNATAATGVGPLDVVDPAEVRVLFEVGILGVFHGIRAFTEPLKATAQAGGRAAILNIGSEHSLGVPPHVMPLSTYTVTKYATLGFTDTARRDLSGTGVQVTLLAPGWVRTESIQHIIESSPEAAAAIGPFAQDSADVARMAWDGVLDGRYIVATNPASVEFVLQHNRDVTAEMQRLTTPAEDHPHDGTGDISRCPVAHLLD